MKFTVATLFIGSAAAYSTSSFSGSALKASANGAAMKMDATGMGVNGFGRIGRLGKFVFCRDGHGNTLVLSKLPC